MGKVISTHSLNFGAPASGADVTLPAGPIAGGAFSLAFWFKYTAAPGGSQFFFAQGAGATNQIQVRSFAAGKLVFAGDSAFAFSLTGNTAPSVGAWHHGCLAYDGAAATLYLDGAADGSAAGTPVYTNAVGLLGRGLGANFNVPGLLDDFRVYPFALSPSQVLQLAVGLDVTGASDYWPFEEGSGLTTADRAGQLTGTLSGGVAWSADVPRQLQPPVTVTDPRRLWAEPPR